MQLSTKKKKYLRWALTGVLMTGMVFVTGFLSFTGMLALNDSVYYAIAAFFFAGGIEGEIYAQNINSSLLDLFSSHALEEKIYAQFLDELKKIHPDHPFIKDYAQIKERIHSLEKAHDHSLDKDLKDAKRSLKWMNRRFTDFMNNKTTPENFSFHESLAGIITQNDKDRLNAEITEKRKKIRLSWLVNIGAGLSCALVGLEAAQSSIAVLCTYFGITLSATVLTSCIFAIAIIGALGYTLLIHNTLNKMIQNDTLQKWKKAIVDFFTQKPANFKQGLKLFGSALAGVVIIGLSVFATIATAGTWWNAAEAGAKMLPLIALAATQVRTLAVAIMAVTTLLFNIVSSLKSIQRLSQIAAHFSENCKKSMDGLKATFQKYQNLENKWQLYNPARAIAALITIPFTAFSFVLHLICMGTASNDLAGMDAATTTELNLTSEFFADFDWIFHDHDHGHGHDNDHIHIDIVGKVLKYVILSPLYFLGAVWDYKFSQANTDSEKVLTFKQALKKSFSGLPEKHNIVPLQLSAEWIKLEKQNRVEKAKSKRAARYTQEPGNEVIRDLETAILAPQALPQAPAYVNNDGSINESSFFKDRPLGQATRETCEKLIKIANGPQYKLSNA